LRRAGRMDLLQDFGYPLPLFVVADILGFRREHRPELRRWSSVLAAILSFFTTIEQDLQIRQVIVRDPAVFR